MTALIGPKGAPGADVTFRIFPRRGAERWLLETRFRRPWHLETWPQASRRARIIYRVARLLGVAGAQLPSRRISLRVVKGSPYDLFSARFDALGVFLGTPGPNRKFVVYAKDGDRSWFIKVASNPETVALAQHEAATLAALADDASLSELVPRCFWIGDALAIEDVRASGAVFAPLDDSEILRVHDLLFARSRTEVPLKEFALHWQTELATTTPHADTVTARQIETARHAAHAFLESLPPHTTFECYDAHGDFTRWNVLRARDGSARIIDWELFGMRPKFFDPFHYIVSQAILVNRMPADAILKQINRMTACALDEPSTWLYFSAYVVSQVFFYANIFERQDVLHAQAHWQLKTWTELLTRLNRSSTWSATILGLAGPDGTGGTQ